MRASVSTTRSPEDVDMTVHVHAVATSAFDLPDHLARKADPALIAGDEQHFAAIAESFEHSIADLCIPRQSLTRFLSKLVMRVRFSSPAPDHRS